jgi:uncharacterized protein YhaN
MVDIIEADASHEEAIQAQEENLEEEILEEIPAEKTEEKSTERQPTAKEFKAVDGARKAFEKENKTLKEELAKRADLPATGDPMEAVRLGKALADHSEEEADIIITYAKGKFNNLKPTPEQIIQASKDEWVKDAIQAKRDKVKAENNTPSPSSPSSIIGGKTSEDVGKMDTKDFAKFARETLKGGRSGV